MKVALVKTYKDNVRIVVLFHVDTEGFDVSNLGLVCLSRLKPGGCNYPLSALHEHDYHAPIFSSVADADQYIERVKADIMALIQNSGMDVEVVKMTLSSSETNGHDGTETGKKKA